MAIEVKETELAGAAPFQIRVKPLLSGPNRFSSQSLLVLETRLQGPVRPLFEPLRGGLDLVEAIAAAPGGQELAELLHRAMNRTRGEAAAKVMLEIASLLQEPFVISGGEGRAGPAGDQALAVLLPAEDGHVGVAAWDLAMRIVLAMQGGAMAGAKASVELVDLHAKFAGFANNRSLGLSSLALARAAKELDIPLYHPDPAAATIQLGQGKNRHLYYSTMVGTTSHVAVNLSHDKLATTRELQQAGLPVLSAFGVSNEEEALAAAEKIGRAVVIKPVDGAKGEGVSIGLTDPDQVREAFRLAARAGSGVMVERFASGDDHRLLIVGGKLIAAARRVPARVTGDGQRTVAELIEMLNFDPRRGEGYTKVMNKVVADSRLRDVLARQSLTLESVPPNGTVVTLSLAGNISQGGTADDVTGTIHPDNREAAERAVARIGLDVAGVDFISPDITRSWREGQGWILELNAPPGLRPHWIANPEQDVATPIVRHLFPDPAAARIPTAAVTGSVGKTTTCQMLAAIARAEGLTAGVATTQGVWSGDFRVGSGDWSSGAAAVSLLCDPMVELGVFEMARGGLAKWGMQFDGTDVAAVLNVHDNHVGLDGISTREQLADVKSIIARHARRAVVLNAEDPLVLKMREVIRAPSLTLVAGDPENPDISAHRNKGGCVVHLAGAGEEAVIRLVEDRRPLLEVPVAAIPAARGGRSRSVISNALFAVATAYHLGLSDESILRGLASFASSFDQNPGRHNWIEGLPFELILNWADGTVALTDIIETLNREPFAGTRHVMLTVPGNRSDEWIRDLGRTAAGHFDRYFCAEMEAHLRGREPGTAPALIAEGLRSQGVPASAIVEAGPQAQSVAMILREARAGDRVLLATYDAADGLQEIEKFRRELAARHQ